MVEALLLVAAVASDTAGLVARCVNETTEEENGRLNVEEVSREVRPRSDARNAISYMFCVKRGVPFCLARSVTFYNPGTQVRFGHPPLVGNAITKQ